MADVRAFDDRNARIFPQLPGQLAVGDIHGEHCSCARLQEAVGEAAGGCPDIQSSHSFYVQRKKIQRPLQLQSAAADVGIFGPLDLDVGVHRHQRGGLVHRSIIYPDGARQNQGLRFLNRRREPP